MPRTTINLLRIKRLAAGLTKVDLADKLGVSYQLITNWETLDCWPGPRLIPKLAKIFDQSAESLARELEEARSPSRHAATA